MSKRMGNVTSRSWVVVLIVLLLLAPVAAPHRPRLGPPISGELAGAALNASAEGTAGQQGGPNQPTPTPVTGSGMSAADDQVALDTHNQARQAVGIPNLIWSPEMATVACNWAEQIVSGGKLVHSSDAYRATNNPIAPGQVMGENIASSGPSNSPNPATYCFVSHDPVFNGKNGLVTVAPPNHNARPPVL